MSGLRWDASSGGVRFGAAGSHHNPVGLIPLCQAEQPGGTTHLGILDPGLPHQGTKGLGLVNAQVIRPGPLQSLGSWQIRWRLWRAKVPIDAQDAPGLGQNQAGFRVRHSHVPKVSHVVGTGHYGSATADHRNRNRRVNGDIRTWSAAATTAARCVVRKVPVCRGQKGPEPLSSIFSHM